MADDRAQIYQFLPVNLENPGFELNEALEQLFHDVTQLYEDSGWFDVTFANSWVNFGSGLQDAQYRKIAGTVHLRGTVKDGTLNTEIFTLPVGFRPNNQLVFTTMQSDVSVNQPWRLDVFSTGVVRQVNAPSGLTTFVSLEGVHFRAEQ